MIFVYKVFGISSIKQPGIDYNQVTEVEDNPQIKSFFDSNFYAITLNQASYIIRLTHKTIVFQNSSWHRNFYFLVFVEIPALHTFSRLLNT